MKKLPKKKRCCGNCVWFIPPQKPVGNWLDSVGECRDAFERARKVVPVSINLSESIVYAHGGKDCPCFDRKADLC